jgi:hypothetical protein
VYELQGNRIHAVTQTGRARTIIEDVAQMCIAASARYGRARHSQSVVLSFLHVGCEITCQKLGQPGTGIELGARVVQRRVAADATIEASA